MPKLSLEEKTKNINNLVESKMNNMLDIIESAMTKQEMLDAIADIIDYVKKAEKDLGGKIDTKTKTALNDLERFKQDYKKILDELSLESSTKLSDIRQKALDRVSEFFIKKNVTGQLNEINNKVNTKLGEVNSTLDDMRAFEFPTTGSIAEEASKLVTVEKLNLEEELPKQGKPIRDSLELLEGNERLKIEAIKDLRKELDELKKSVKLASSSIGGSVGKLYSEHEQFDGDDSTVDFTLSYAPDVGGKTAWVYLNGQFLANTTHWSISGNKLTLTFTPITGDTVSVTYLRK